MRPPSRQSIPQFHAETGEQWRSWLDEHHATAGGVWLVSWKKPTGRPAMSYDEAVTVALAYGWIDSLPSTLDGERTMLYFTARRASSGWSRPNKVRIAHLEATGALTAAGRRVVEAAHLDGSWSMLDDVENLVVPGDLAAALDAVPGARQYWDGFPRSARRGILEWIVLARRPATRAARIDETARAAGNGERAHQWSRDASRPPRTTIDPT